MPNISSSLADLAIIRSLTLQRVSNGMSQDVANIYNDIIKDITHSVKTAESDIVLKNLNVTIRDLKAMVVTNFDFLKEDLTELAKAEALYTYNSVNAIIGTEIFKTFPTEKTLERIYSTTLIQGAYLGEYMKSLDASMKEDITRSMRLSVSMGETNHEASKRLNNVLGANVRHSQTIAKTATMSIANQARNEVYESNDDIIKQWQYLSVLDSRTSDFCKAYSNLIWDFQTHKPIGHKMPFRRPPMQTHWNCRSQLIPILKSFEELDMPELSELPKSTQSSMSGQVSQDINFNQWLKTQPKKTIEDALGVGRADMFLDGKITMSQLINQQGRTLTISELKEKYG